VQAHPELIFVYGQDYSNKGCLGQAWAIGNEPNTFPIPTLYKVCNSQSDKYFSDDQYLANCQKIDEAIAKIPRDGRPIIVPPKIGCGHSQLWIKAPQTYAYLVTALKILMYPNIVWKWTVGN
jgi:hypothetical protein